MKNTVLKFKKDKIGAYRVSDYFSKNTDLRDLDIKFPELAKLFKSGTIDDNSTIEGLTNHIYSNPNLWDFITLINERDPLFGMPYDYDTLIVFAENRLKEFLKQHPRINITQDRKDELLAKYRKEIIEENEKNRTIVAFDPKHLSSVITALRQKGVI